MIKELKVIRRLNMGKVTWNDLQEATHHELKKSYNLTDRQLEQQIRSHWDGANHNERVKLYEKVYLKNNRIMYGKK